MRWSEGRGPDTLWPGQAAGADPTPLMAGGNEDLRPLVELLQEGAPFAAKAPAAAADEPDDAGEDCEPLFGAAPVFGGARSATRPAAGSRGIRFAERPPTAGGSEPVSGPRPTPATPAGSGAGRDFEDFGDFEDGDGGPGPLDGSQRPAAGADDGAPEGGADTAAVDALSEEVAGLRRERDVLRDLLSARQEELGAAVGRLDAIGHAVRAQLTESVVRLATLIAKRVVERELEADPQLVVTLTRTAVAQLESCMTAEVRVHPTDFPVVRQHLQRGSEHVEYPVVRVVADGAVSRGGCVVVTDGAEVDGRIETRLLRLEETLRTAMTDRVAQPAAPAAGGGGAA